MESASAAAARGVCAVSGDDDRCRGLGRRVRRGTLGRLQCACRRAAPAPAETRAFFGWTIPLAPSRPRLRRTSQRRGAQAPNGRSAGARSCEHRCCWRANLRARTVGDDRRVGEDQLKGAANSLSRRRSERRRPSAAWPRPPAPASSRWTFSNRGIADGLLLHTTTRAVRQGKYFGGLEALPLLYIGGMSGLDFVLNTLGIAISSVRQLKKSQTRPRAARSEPQRLARLRRVPHRPLPLGRADERHSLTWRARVPRGADRRRLGRRVWERRRLVVCDRQHRLHVDGRHPHPRCRCSRAAGPSRLQGWALGGVAAAALVLNPLFASRSTWRNCRCAAVSCRNVSLVVNETSCSASPRPASTVTNIVAFNAPPAECAVAYAALGSGFDPCEGFEEREPRRARRQRHDALARDVPRTRLDDLGGDDDDGERSAARADGRNGRRWCRGRRGQRQRDGV